MSAGRQWVQEARGNDPRPTTRERREPVDLGRWVEVATVVGGVALIYGGIAFYLVGGGYAAYLVGGWVGALLLAAFGIPPMAYALVKWNQRKAEHALHARIRRQQEQASGSGGDYDTFE